MSPAHAILDTHLPALPEPFGNPLLRDFSEIVPASSVDWWPQTPGWYVLGFGLALWLVVKGWRAARRWLRNRYRREALRRLAQLDADLGHPAAVNALLKTTAIEASSRVEVAGLSGASWVSWLKERVDQPFNSQIFERCLGAALYTSSPIDRETMAALSTAARSWIQHHRDDHAPN